MKPERSCLPGIPPALAGYEEAPNLHCFWSTHWRRLPVSAASNDASEKSGRCTKPVELTSTSFAFALSRFGRSFCRVFQLSLFRNDASAAIIGHHDHGMPLSSVKESAKRFPRVLGFRS
jgi:hypothetical protein